MKAFLCTDKRLTYFWIVGFVLLFADHVRGFNEECPGGPDAHLERWVLEKFLSWMPYELKNPDDICVSRVGTGSYLCRDEYNNNYSEICQCLWCRDPVLETCRPVSSNDGIQCGDQKWCYNGKCLYSELAVEVEDSCPFGDNKGYSQNGLSCQQLIPGDRKSCYDDVTEQMCCGSCSAHESVTQGGCQYGDRIEGCQLNMCALMSDTELNSCCQTCGYYTEVVPTRRPEVTVAPLISIEISTLSPGPTASTTNIEITTKKLPNFQTSKSTSPSATTVSSTNVSGTNARTTSSSQSQTTPSTTKGTSTSTEPTDTAQTTKPTNPAQTTKPIDPAETTKLTDPAQTTKPTDTAQTTKPTDPAQTTKPIDPAQTTKPTDPAQTTKPTDPVQTTKPTEPAQTTKPTDTAQTTESTDPTQRTESTDPTQTTKPTDPTQTTKPTDPTQTTESTDPTQTKNASDTTSTSTSTSTVTTSVAGSEMTSTTSPVTTTTTEQQTNSQQQQTQDDNSNAVAIGTGTAVGGLTLITTVATVTYVIKKRLAIPSNSSPANNNVDCDSIGGDSLTGLTSGMMGTSSRWYPGYASTHPMG